MFPRKSNTRYYDDPHYVAGLNNTYARTPTGGQYIYPQKQYYAYDAQNNLYPYGYNCGVPGSLGYSTPIENSYRGFFSQTGTKSGSGSLTGPSLHAMYLGLNRKQMLGLFPIDVANQK